MRRDSPHIALRAAMRANKNEEEAQLSPRDRAMRRVVSVEILPIATQQCRNYLYDKS